MSFPSPRFPSCFCAIRTPHYWLGFSLRTLKFSSPDIWQCFSQTIRVQKLSQLRVSKLGNCLWSSSALYVQRQQTQQREELGEALLKGRRKETNGESDFVLHKGRCCPGDLKIALDACNKNHLLKPVQVILCYLQSNVFSTKPKLFKNTPEGNYIKY